MIFVNILKIVVGVSSVQGSADRQRLSLSSRFKVIKWMEDIYRKEKNEWLPFQVHCYSLSGAVMVVWSLMTDMGEWLEGKDTDSGSIEPFISSLSTEWMVSPCMEPLLYSRQGGGGVSSSMKEDGDGETRGMGIGEVAGLVRAGGGDCRPVHNPFGIIASRSSRRCELNPQIRSRHVLNLLTSATRRRF